MNWICNQYWAWIQILFKLFASPQELIPKLEKRQSWILFSQYYQEPLCLDPLDPDPDKDGKKSDHRIVLLKPINEIDNQCARITRHIKVRPITESGIKEMRSWLMDESWKDVYSAESAHQKAEIFQQMLLDKFQAIFPEKTRKISSVFTPWMTQKLKKIDRRRKRVNHKQRRSEKSGQDF